MNGNAQAIASDSLHGSLRPFHRSLRCLLGIIPGVIPQSLIFELALLEQLTTAAQH